MFCLFSFIKGDNLVCYFIEKDYGLLFLVSKGEFCIVDDI